MLNRSLRKTFHCLKILSANCVSKYCLLNHEESVHTENVPLLEDFTCKLCSEVFITKDILLNHEQFVHTDDLTESNCDEIQKEVDLKVKKTLELAEASPQISVKVKKFECNICLTKFRSKDNQQLHM